MKTKLNSLQTKFITTISSFEPITNSELKLQGGFSQAIVVSGGLDPETGTGEANNCMGGNCAINCSIHQNNGCNTAVGCGK